MKKATLSFSLLIMACLLFVLACQKSDTPQSGNVIPEKTVTASVQGRVVDQDGIPVSDAVVKTGTATASTDINGVFHLDEVKLSDQFGYITVDKAGFFQGSRSIITEEGAFNYIQIELLPKTQKGSFTASGGGTISVDGTINIIFAPGSIINKADSTVYDGEVKVYAAYVDPTAEALEDKMPGGLRGVDANDALAGLKSYGMVVVEMEGTAGEQLGIAQNKTAVLAMEIPAGLQTSAPGQIPLWHFDDADGRWKEDGTATRQGSTYTASVKHFSFWGFNEPFEIVRFKAAMMDADGLPLQHLKVIIEEQWANDSRTMYGYTNTEGVVTGAVPQSAGLIMQVYNECGEMIYTGTYAPSAVDVDWGVITIDDFTASLMVTGSVVNCEGQPVNDGIATLTLNGLIYRSLIKNGVFNIDVVRCSATETEAGLLLADNETQETGQVQTISVTSGTVDVGELTACGTPYTHVLKYTVGDVDRMYTNVNSHFIVENDTARFFYMEDVVNQHYFQMRFANEPDETGAYLVAEFFMIAGDQRYRKVGDMYATVSDDVANRVLTGTFAGSVIETLDSDAIPLTGSFRLKY